MINEDSVNCITDVFQEPGKTDGALVFDFERHHSFNREMGMHAMSFLVDHQLEGILGTHRQ